MEESNALDEALHDLSDGLRLQATSHFGHGYHYKKDPIQLTISDDLRGDGNTNDILSDTDSTLLETGFEELSDLAYNSEGSMALTHEASHYLPTLPITWPLDDDGISDGHHLSGGRKRKHAEPHQGNLDIENRDEGVILVDF